jgi:anhydro-N-acetylmuramic acid kinase
MQNKVTKIIGIMSGTSLDGLDMALCEFQEENNQVHFKLVASETIKYDAFWKERLQNACHTTAENYFKLHATYGEFIAESINDFLKKNNQTADYIASHGHTVFHQPALGFSTQIGCGATIASKTGIATICDFRSMDVALGGQGAPLVPIGDRDLFSQYDSCLNIGGIANISFTKNNTTQAFDICIANMALNYLCELIGKTFDDGGLMASQGTLNTHVLAQLVDLKTDHKSLGREWFENHMQPLLDTSAISIEDKLATCVEFCAIHIGNVLNTHSLKSVFITGGGAYNHFLINQLKKQYADKIEIPSDDIIQFKEAIIFAYLGYLKINNKPNALASVTKASRDSSGGCIY